MFDVVCLGTHHLAIEIVLSNHDGVDRLWVDKVEEGKASRTTRELVAHDGTVAHFAELRKVPTERVYAKGARSMSFEDSGKKDSVKGSHD